MANNTDSPLFNDPSKTIFPWSFLETILSTLLISVPVRQADIQFLTSTNLWIGLIKSRPKSKTH